ncbi:MAG: FkbM family methyltransferase [Oryzomonas sp.]|uniref:FkbM family methyltransferase n=1 Tax=Oryzomonas sp. TaxID=2855186 RepID=UPI00284BE7A9|nr:FkbM family methyltransferase [Oryzomonas sp.]MDR3579535.1 FkbM family methyltransferase [Oryzomonas sp.]
MADRISPQIDAEILENLGHDDVICNVSIQWDSNSRMTRMKLHLDRKKYMHRSFFVNSVQNGNCYEPDYTSIMLKVLRPGDTVIDIGANFGYFSLLASSLVTSTGRVISIEPDKENFFFLIRNIEINKMSNIKAINCAAGNLKKEIDFFLDPLNDGAHSLCGISPETIQQIGDKNTVTSKIQMDMVDSLLNSENIANIKIIKVDTEGWEFHTIEGAISVIKRFSPIILAEVNRSGLRRSGASEKYLRLLMQELGYSTFIATYEKNTNKVYLESVPQNYYAEPELEHYNYNAVFARPESLKNLSQCCYVLY